MKKTLLIIPFLLINIIICQSVIISDADTNSLIEINDEGTTGSITLPSNSSAPSTKTNKLYNVSGSLNWNGTTLGVSGSAGGWTDDGSIVRLSTSTDRLGLGLTSPNALANMEIYRNTSGVPLFINNHRGGSSFSPASSITYGLLTTVASDDSDSKFGIVTNALGDGGTKYAIWADANGTGTNWAGYFNDGNVYVANQVGLGTTSLNSLVQLDVTRTSQGCPIFINNHRGGSSFSPASSITYGLLTSVASDDADSKFGIVTNALGDGGTKYAIWADANGTGTNWAGYFNDGNVYVANQVGLGTTSLNSLVQLDVTRTSQGCPIFINNHRGGSSFSPASSITYGLLTSVASDDADSKFGIVTNALGDGGTKYAIWADANGTGTNWCGYFNDGNVYIANDLTIGTTSPSSETQLHIQTDTDDNFGVLVESKGTAGSEIGLHTDDGNYSSLVKNAYFSSGSWNRFSTSYGSFAIEVTPAGESNFNVAAAGSNPISWTKAITIETNGEVGIGTENPAGKLDVNGSIFQRGGSIHADYVFNNDYELETIQEHNDFMWSHKHLSAIPKAQIDKNGNEFVEIGAHRKGIVEELEKAHIYIAQLEERIRQIEESLVSQD